MTEPTLQKATFAAGCFWSVEYKFSQQAGVVSATSGYEGGFVEAPNYKQVCTDRTGHAEVVEVQFDPSRTSYETLLRYFFTMHDPTTRNRQGVDVGTQYRSAIFHHSPEQQATAQAVMQSLDAAEFSGRIVTELLPAATFWRAEEYHQKYNEKHPERACSL